jgi:hypothetical protein
MPPKKSKEAAAGLPFVDIDQRLLQQVPTRWVQVHFKLVTTNLLDDVVRLPPTATLHMVANHISKHHGGSVSHLKFWKDDIRPNNILRDMSKTLAEVWNLSDDRAHTIDPIQRSVSNPYASSTVARVGSHDDVPDHEVVLCYDYKTHDSDCPLILRSPRYTINGHRFGSTTAGFVNEDTKRDATAPTAGAGLTL